jgi:hypothetical protein
MNHVAVTNGRNGSAGPTPGALDAFDYHIQKLAPVTGRPIAKPASVLVIPVWSEARNIAWVLEQIAADVNEIIVVDVDSTDAALITALSELRSRRVHADRYVESSPHADSRSKLHAEPL